MKKSIALAALLAACLSVASAQQAGPRPGGPGGPGGMRGPGGPGGPGGRMAKVNAEIMKQLNLTADQKKKVDALQKSTMTKMKTAFEGAKGDRSAMRDKMMTIRKDHEKALFAILTDAQEKKYVALRKAAMEKMRKEWGGGRPGGAPSAKPPKP